MHACEAQIPWAMCVCLIGQQAAIRQQQQQMRQVVDGRLVIACSTPESLQAHFRNSRQLEGVPARGCMHMLQTSAPHTAAAYRLALAAGSDQTAVLNSFLP